MTLFKTCFFRIVSKLHKDTFELVGTVLTFALFLILLIDIQIIINKERKEN